MELTLTQLQALDRGEAVPLMIDGRSYVLLRDSDFEKVRVLLDEWHPLTMQRQMADVMRDEWSDPAMDAYNE